MLAEKATNICFDWSNNCDNLFWLRNSKKYFNYFEEKYFATQTINKCQCACSDMFLGEIVDHFA